MSDVITADEMESKLSLVVRKPQEGKTTICITNITKDKTKNIHIVLTMNTLASGMQFFGRMQEEVGKDRIVVFNSDKKTAGGCHYAKNVTDVIKLINTTPIKVVVCCANVKRIRESLPDLFDFAVDSKKIMSTNIKFTIHIDEAHKYICENTTYIHKFNNCPIVAEIIGYSATPNEIWSAKASDPLFGKILIRDVEAELSIMRSTNYFGVKDCRHHLFDELDTAQLAETFPCEIPPHILKLANMAPGLNPKEWYGNSWYFDLGNEALMLGFLNYVLPTLHIAPDTFSYHFAPAYTRKVTHYQSVDIILSHYPSANVIVLNGNGYELFRQRDGKSAKICWSELVERKIATIQNIAERRRKLDALREPAYMVQQLIANTPNYPTFITGFTCVGMSVTLINQEIGNFDNVIMAHDHYSRDKLYQLCRFLFNYEKWAEESRGQIKKTQFYSLTTSVIHTCLEYESQIDKMATEFAGKTCSLREIQGLEEEPPSVREIKKQTLLALNAHKPRNEKLWRKFKVYEGNDAEQWEKAQNFYQEIRGKKIVGKSMPKQNDQGFYVSSDSDGLDVQTTSTFINLEQEKWTNRFQLKKGGLSYARVFVGYDNLTDPSEYTIFIKYVQLEDIPEVHSLLTKYCDCKNAKKDEANARSDEDSQSI